MGSTTNLRETHLEGNDLASWTPGSARDLVQSGQIAAATLDAFANVGVFLIDPTSGTPCRLVDLRRVGLLPWELRWSPDGSSLAVSNDLWAGSGEAHLLIWSDGSEPMFSRPWIGTERPAIAWSPDSATLAVVAGRSVTLLEADGAPPRIIECESCRAPARVAWSPDGRRLAIQTPAAGGGLGTTSLLLADVEAGSSAVLDIPFDRINLVAWLDGGSVLVIDSERDELLEVRVDPPVDVEARASIVLPDGVALVVSPNLGHAAYLSNQQRSDEELVVLDLSTGDATTLARTAELGIGLPIGDLVWSPDGASLAFTQLSGSDPDIGDLAGDLWRVSIDGGDLRRVLRGPFDLFDGRAIGTGLEPGSWRPGTDQ
jgi:dipeptidyl aminopeptidase/acylaminoacyl peptidase